MNDKKYNELILDTSFRLKDFLQINNKCFIITGVSGLIGTFVLDVLQGLNNYFNFNIIIIAFTRDIETAKKKFEKHKKNIVYTQYSSDSNDWKANNYKADYILHFASNANPTAFDIDPIGTIKSNVSGTLDLLEFSRKNNVKKFLFASSSEIYGESTKGEMCETDSGLVNSLSPRMCYTESKRMAENICVNYYKQYGVETIINRFCYIYGPTFTDYDCRVVPQFVRNGLNKKEILMKSSGKMVRSYCYLPDAVVAMFYTLILGKSGEAYNICNPNSNVSIKEIADTVANVAGVTVTINSDKDQGNSPFSKMVLCGDKLYCLGFKAKYSLHEGITNLMDILEKRVE